MKSKILKKVHYYLVLMSFLTFFSLNANAATNDIKSQQFQDKKTQIQKEIDESKYNPLRKMARGITNTALCWVEIPKQVMEATKDTNEKKKAIVGSLKGFTYTAGRFCVGVYELVTFLVPPYRPIVKPEFVFEEEEELDVKDKITQEWQAR